jgi:DNA helicase II / ATP-dependent DNA helicase PcrA
MKFSVISEQSVDALLDQTNGAQSDPGDRLELDDRRRSAIINYADIQACPGSGKTTLVGLKILLLLMNWNETYSGICALTHTNVAKAEILARLSSHRAGHTLLTYPHFIGTIQDFVDTYLALPYARSRGWDVRLCDEVEFAELLASQGYWNFKVHDKVANKAYRLSYYIKRGKVDLGMLRLEYRDSKLSVSSAFLKRAASHIDVPKSSLFEDQLLKTRLRLCDSGIFHYSEMYELAKQAVAANPDLLEALRARFKITILDEMQDTQRHQDDLINLIFPKTCCIIQKFGDPDQAIFDSMGGGLPNTSYNDASLNSITDSHRFGPHIAATLGAFSYRGIGQITSSKPPTSNSPRNTIFLFDDSTITKVLPAFGDLVSRLPADRRSAVKAVGGVGKLASANGLALQSYWPEFDSKLHLAHFRPNSLCHAVKVCTELGEGDIAPRYQLLVGAIIELLKRTGRKYTGNSGKKASFSRPLLTSYLREGDKVLAFGDLLSSLILEPFPSEELWVGKVAKLNSLLELGVLSGTAAEFVAYDSADLSPSAGITTKLRNVFQCESGVQIALSTIHGVKGETHDATLVCETKYSKWFDIQEMREFLCNPSEVRPIYDPEKPSGKESVRAAFMKRLYVAMSRPRFLLCLAVKKGHLEAQDLEYLHDALNWSIIDIQ